MAFQGAFALNQASAIRIGNLLGAGNPLQAKVTLRALLFCAIILAWSNFCAILPNGRRIGYLMTSDPEVVENFQQIITWLAGFQIVDGGSP